MAVVPLLPPGGFTVLARNLREARRQGQPRNMALPGTYYWFYQQVKIGALGITNSKIAHWLTLVISIMGQPVLRLEFPQKFC